MNPRERAAVGAILGVLCALALVVCALRQYLREERPGLGRVSPHPEENP